ncbi:hypothetical protein ACFWFF_02875 [Streptomyces sp. NPDC060223]|uniref:hypothetical protein n=1 Tax=unclassified Streptomyces TaxID=2593676 RepID=UPI0036346AF8
MRPPRRVSRTALLVTTALLLSSCDIPKTGVVEVGEPATGIRRSRSLDPAAGTDTAPTRHRHG